MGAFDLYAEMDDTGRGGCPQCARLDTELVFAFGKAVSCVSCVMARVAAGQPMPEWMKARIANHERGMAALKAWIVDFNQNKIIGVK